MNLFVYQIRRNMIINSCLLLLIVVAIIISSIGLSAWIESEQQLSCINDHYTTIAILSGANHEKHFLEGMTTFVDVDSLHYPDGSKYIGPMSAMKTAQESPVFLSAQSNILLSAYIEGSTAITSGTVDILQYNAELDNNCYSLSVFAVECEKVEVYDYLSTDSVVYEVVFDIVDRVCLMDAYDVPPYEDKLFVTTGICNRNGEIPFEVGKTYLLRGRYSDYPMGPTRELVTDENGETHWQWTVHRLDYIEDGGRSLVIMGDGGLISSPISDLGVTTGVQNFTKEKIQYPGSELCYWTTPENCWPYYAEYVGDWQDYLETEEGRVWKEEIIPNFEMNHASATVILTDNLETMYSFNTGDASILEGRIFDKTEYQNGTPVCIVSASYAMLNGYSIGDTIPLNYYDAGYEQVYYGLGTIDGRQGVTVSRFPLTEESCMDFRKEYTIIGIYTAPEWTAGQHSFHADTIFVPKASVPGMDTYSGKALPMLSAITIQNGSINAFEAHMAANDNAGAYLYFDQGYTEAAASVQTLIDNAKRIMIVGISMYTLSSLLFILLYVRRAAPVIRTMRLLGVSAKKTWSECFMSLIWQVVIAVLIGNVLAIVLYDRITQMVLSASLELSYGSVALCGAVQFLILFAIGMIWTRSVANRNLMQNR